MKLKQSNAIRTADERLLRQYSDKISHLTERNDKYKKLLKERDLEAREFLTHELEAEREKTSLLEKTIAVSAGKVVVGSSVTFDEGHATQGRFE